MTYVYRRADGSEFEIDQRMSDAPLTACPTTGQAVERLIVNTSRPALNGPGWTPIHHTRR
jgi:predicted nucleic acid-binding Zn ribbon protein